MHGRPPLLQSETGPTGVNPLGVPGSQPTRRTNGPSDTRRTLYTTRGIVANFRRAPCLNGGSGIRLQASNGRYVVAQRRGRRARRPAAADLVGTVTVVDTIGGCLAPGDMSSRTSSGFHLRARGGGSSPRSDRAAADAWARFVGGGPRGSGPLQSRDQFTLQAYSGHYVGAERGVEAPRGSTARRPACGGGSPSHADHNDGWHSARRRRHRAALATALELALGKRAWRGRGVEDRERPGRASHQTAAGSTSAQPPSRPAWGSKP